MIGQTITHYRIVDTLGSGGMGVVYLAEDTKLKRSVALKFLPAERTQDEDAKRRFEIEAQAASALDHPNIGTIYEIDEAPDGRLFIAMAYYKGETIKTKIARGPIALTEAIDYAKQIAAGLAKAHAAGIVHRDIKPANLLVTGDGFVKILDFGVAKLVGPQEQTRTELTGVGVAVGTPTYMSPEQSVGAAADARSDIWALGVVLYEMVAGRLPTSGDHSSPAASIVAEGAPPPLSSVRPDVPPELDRLVGRTLAQRADDRHQSASDLLAELRLVAPSSATASVAGTATVLAPPPTRRRSMVTPLVAVGVIALAAIAYVLWARPGAPAGPPQLTNPRQLATSVGVELLPSWSADGKILAYQSDQTGNNDIWVMQIGSPAVNRTADFAGGDEAPRLSPDGRQIAFWSAREGGGIFVMPTLGGSPRRIGLSRPDAASAAAWSANGTEIVFPVFAPASEGGLRLDIVTLSTGAIRKVPLPISRPGGPPRPGPNACLDLAWSPDGRFLALVQANSYNNQTSTLWVVRLEDQTFVRLTDNTTVSWSPSWSADSRTLFFTSNRNGGTMDLWQQRLSAEGEASGTPEQLTTGLDIQHAALTTDGNKIAYAKGRRVANVWRMPIPGGRLATWSDATQITLDQAYIEAFDLSPDGQRLAIQSDRGGYYDIWVLPAVGGELQRITNDNEPDWWPAWSPDGREIAFYSNRNGGTREAWIQPIAGGEARQVTRGGGLFPRWSRDGTSIYLGNLNIIAVPSRGGPTVTTRDAQKAEVIIKGDPARSFSTMEFSVEPDGRSFVMTSGRQPERRLWRVSSPGGEFTPLTKGQATAPSWSPDGKWVYFHTFRESGGTTYQLERPGLNIWRVSADGKREEPVTNLTGKRGVLGANIANDGKYVYFTWREDVSDIWMMDVQR